MIGHSDVPEAAVTVQEMARLLTCSKDTVYQLARDKRIPAFKVGAEWRFFPSKVNEALTAEKDIWAQPTRSLRRRRAA